MGTPSPANPTGRAIHYFLEDPKAVHHVTYIDNAFSTTASCGGSTTGCTNSGSGSECSLVSDLRDLSPVATCNDGAMDMVCDNADMFKDPDGHNPNLYIGMFLPWEIELQPTNENLKVEVKKKNRSKKDKKERNTSKKMKKSKKSHKSKKVKEDEPYFVIDVRDE